MNQNLFYFLLLIIICIIRFTFLFDLLVLSILILLVINSIGFELEGITTATVAQTQDGMNIEKPTEGLYGDSM